MIPAEETGFLEYWGCPGAEGATAPETLRPKDRGELALWKAMTSVCDVIHRRG